MRRTLILVAAGLALAGAARAAPDGGPDVECMWQRLPEAARAKVAAPDPVPWREFDKVWPGYAAQFDGPALAAAERACGIPAGMGTLMLERRVQTEQGRRWMTARSGLAAERIDALWPRSDSLRFREAAADQRPAFIDELLGRIGVATSPAASAAAESYLMGRSNTEYLEGALRTLLGPRR